LIINYLSHLASNILIQAAAGAAVVHQYDKGDWVIAGLDSDEVCKKEE
jgi:hypothetical protein